MAWEVVQLVGVSLPELPVKPAMISAGLAGAILLFTVIKFLVDNEARHWPAWIGLILAILIAVGGWLRWSGDAPKEMNLSKSTSAPPPAAPPPPTPAPRAPASGSSLRRRMRRRPSSQRSGSTAAFESQRRLEQEEVAPDGRAVEAVAARCAVASSAAGRRRRRPG